MSTRDFRATQVRTHAIIGSGSSPQLLLYPSASATNQYGGVILPGTGSDAWMFVSGAIGTTTGRVVFGGDLVMSGNLSQGSGNSASNLSHAQGLQTTASGLYSHAEGTGSLASGNYSHAEGLRATASALWSHAEGKDTTASNTYSHAEGSDSLASGIGSHAEGNATVASGSGSHAEGGGTDATGTWSHAEGANTTASGAASHAEGDSTQATGDYSHSEGSSTSAQGSNSHAEGVNTVAAGNESHAEGQDTITVGRASHAEGRQTVAIGRSSHSQGWMTTASGSYSLAAGIGTIASGSGQSVFGQYNLRGNDYSLLVVGNGSSDGSRADVLRVETGGLQVTGSLSVTGNATVEGNFTVNGTTTTVNTTNLNVKDSIILFGSGAVGTNRNGGIALASGSTETDKSLVFGRIANDVWGVGKLDVLNGTSTSLVGMDLVAIRAGKVEIGGSTAYLTTSQGNTVGVMGTDLVFSSNKIFLTGSITQGNGSTASGNYSHSEGNGTTASGDYSHSEGQSTTANGLAAHAEGLGSTSSGWASHAEGRNASALASFSHAEGNNTIANGDHSHAEGRQTNSNGDSSHSEGYSSTASGDYSHAEGRLTTASGEFSHAEGFLATASGRNSHAEGSSTVASATGSHAEGDASVASGDFSHAEGNTSVAFGMYSHAEGEYTVARGRGSHAGGIGTIASGSWQTVFGSYNLRNNSNSIFVIGDGLFDDNGARHDILRVDSGSVQITGSFIAPSISGSHTKLADGRSFLVAGTNVTIVSASDGQITISSTGGGGGDSFFSSVTNGEIFTTGSIVTSGTFAIKDGTGTPRFRASTNGNTWITGSVAFTGSFAIGPSGVVASGLDSFAHGQGATASGLYSHAQGRSTIASGPGTHAEGDGTTASNSFSHAEGRATFTSGLASHAEGLGTRAAGLASHAEGYLTTGSGLYSHAEGSGSIAFGSASHAGGIYTIASGSGQTVYGQFNLRGNTSSLFVIGNGTGDANANRSDVLRVESTGLQVTGSGWFSNGISGSHTSLTDGRSFLVAGTNVTITSASDGQITISSAGGGGDTFFSSTTAGSIFTTGSTAFKGAESIDSPTDKGADVFFYVSGAIGSRGTSTVGTAVFGGDVVISGTLFGGSPLKVGTDLQVTGTLSLSTDSRFTATAIQLSGSSGVTGSLVIQNDITSESQLVLSSSTGFSTLNQTPVGDFELRNTKLGGNMTLGVKTSAGNAVNFMTVRPNGAAVSTLVSILPSIYAGPANPVNSTDTNFFVGGTVGSRGGANRGTAVFGGDLVISGTVYTPTGMSVTGSITIQGNILPDGDRVQNLGSPTKRWANVYTGDLHLRNERGDYTLIEEEEFLSIRFNKTGKRYRFLLEPVPHLDEDPNNLS